MAKKESGLNYLFTVNLGKERQKALFLKSLQESKKRKKKISIGTLIREAIDGKGTIK